MFGFGNRRRPEGDPARRGGAAGVALTATSARAALLAPGTGKPKPIPLGEHSDDLAVCCRLGVKPVEPGATGLVRRAPHLVCLNYLNQLGTPRQWQVGRAVTTPEDAVRATLSLIAGRLGGPDAVGLALPPTLSASQVKTVARIATESGLAVRATASAPLATAARHLDPDEDAGLHIVIVDCDDFALTATRLHHDGGGGAAGRRRGVPRARGQALGRPPHRRPRGPLRAALPARPARLGGRRAGALRPDRPGTGLGAGGAGGFADGPPRPLGARPVGDAGRLGGAGGPAGGRGGAAGRRVFAPGRLTPRGVADPRGGAIAGLARATDRPVGRGGAWSACCPRARRRSRRRR